MTSKTLRGEKHTGSSLQLTVSLFGEEEKHVISISIGLVLKAEEFWNVEGLLLPLRLYKNRNTACVPQT
jgi:hypothetical protein